MKNKNIIISVLVILILFFLFLTFNNSMINGNAIKIDELNLAENEAIIFKSQSCGCCVGYISELENNGFEVEVNSISIDELNSIKNDYNIPLDMRSCHTVIIGNYFIEGHMPFEAIEKLLEEKPDVKGIALPGMPSGSPGMPGQKTELWTIYTINNDGSYEEFMII